MVISDVGHQLNLFDPSEHLIDENVDAPYEHIYPCDSDIHVPQLNRLWKGYAKMDPSLNHLVSIWTQFNAWVPPSTSQWHFILLAKSLHPAHIDVNSCLTPFQPQTLVRNISHSSRQASDYRAENTASCSRQLKGCTTNGDRLPMITRAWHFTGYYGHTQHFRHWCKHCPTWTVTAILQGWYVDPPSRQLMKVMLEISSIVFTFTWHGLIFRVVFKEEDPNSKSWKGMWQTPTLLPALADSAG